MPKKLRAESAGGEGRGVRQACKQRMVYRSSCELKRSVMKSVGLWWLRAREARLHFGMRGRRVPNASTRAAHRAAVASGSSAGFKCRSRVPQPRAGAHYS